MEDHFKLRKKEITIKDVARRAGVAVSTVSRVLNGLDKVSDKTRRKVQAAVDELGYVQNQLAVSMVTGQTKTIMMIVPDFTNDFNGAVIQGAETYLKEHGYTILVSSSADFKDADYEALRQRFFRMVDGILAVPSPSDIFNYNSWGKPAVLIDCWRPENDYYTVEINNAWGTYLLTEEMIRKGHRRIAFVGGIQGVSLGGQRLDGFRRAMRDYEIPVDESLIKPGVHFQETGVRGMEELLSLPVSLRPTGVIAVNNLTCIGCMEVLLRHHLTAGKDISLAGFDDHPAARYTAPGITVISRPSIEMGREGARILLQLLQGKKTEPRRLIMDITLLRRGSVQPPHCGLTDSPRP